MIDRFGICAFDDRAAILTRFDRPVALEPPPARALALLLSRAGDVVTREELRAHIRGDDTHVDFDRGLAYCVGQVRAAVGDSAENPRFIQILPRRGFCFIAPVEVTSPDDVRGSTFSVRRSGFVVRGLSFDGTENVDRAIESAEPQTENVEPQTENDEQRTTNAERRTSNDTRRSLSGALLLATGAVFLMVAGAGWWTVSRNQTPDRPIVAVAIFDNETGDASRERAVSTIADTVVERLTALGPSRIGVNGSSRILQNPGADRDPRTVARETHAAFLVAGHLQSRDGRLSLLMHIIRLDDGTHVWVQRISRSPDEGLESLDEDVASQIEKAVRRIVLKDGGQAA